MDAHLGIDLAKHKFDALLLQGEKSRHKVFDNTETGFAALAAWLAALGIARVHACLEATGGFGDDLALFLHAKGHSVSIVNPARIKAYGQSEGVRTKTDKVDAGVIARFCRAQTPPAWTPPSPQLRALRALVRRCAALKAMRAQEINRQKAGVADDRVRTSLATLIAALDAEIAAIAEAVQDLLAADPVLARNHALLTSIPGIGDQSAAVLLAEVADFKAFPHGKQVAAFAGLSPREHSSGSSVRTRAHISRIGSAPLRTTLYLCALSARRHNPVLKTFADRLRKAGKAPKLVLLAVARKLIVIAHALIRHDTPFDPELDAKHGI